MGSDVSARVEKLNKRGIVAFELDGVLARFTKAQSRDQSAVDLSRPLVEIGAALAAQIRDRVTKRGDLASQAPARQGRGKVYLSSDYAGAAHIGGANAQYGKTIPGGTAALHALVGTMRDSYDVSGGMWAGLQARASSKSAVILDFAGTSEGRGKATYGMRQVRTARSDGSSRAYATRRTLLSVLSERVRNQWKAGAIYDRHGVHLLLPSDAETATMAQTVADRMAEFTALRLGLQG